LLLFFIGIREPHSSVCLAHLSTPLKASENEPKEKALSRQVFFKERFSKSLLKNHILKAKFSTRLQKFLTLLKYYTYDKGFVI